MAPEIRDLLHDLIVNRGSELHLTADSPPRIRVDQQIISLKYDPLSPEQCHSLAFSILTENQQKKLETELEVGFAFNRTMAAGGELRFRGNAFFRHGSLAAVVRVIQTPTMEQLGLPKVCLSFVQKPKGLILVTGPSGSGKSTTLAAIVDRINSERPAHIITIEDPVEYVHGHKQAIVNQREVGVDTKSFVVALKQALRQDPDVIMVSELGMRKRFKPRLRRRKQDTLSSRHCTPTQPPKQLTGSLMLFRRISGGRRAPGWQ